MGRHCGQAALELKKKMKRAWMKLKGKSKLFFLLLLLAAVILWVGFFPHTPVGVWYGFVTGVGGKSRLVFVVYKLIDGTFSAHVNSLDSNYENNFKDVSVSGNSVRGEDLSGTSFDLRMNLYGQSLSGHVEMQSKTYDLNLKRGKNFLVPRVNFGGNAVTDYSYQVPREMQDGLETADIQTNGGDRQNIEKSVRGILDSTYPDIHSLLVLRHGKLVLEEYFYGYAAQDEHTLQSATKSVLSILFGIAQDQGLVNVNDKLYDYFPEYRNKPGWSKDKNKLHWGTCYP